MLLKLIAPVLSGVIAFAALNPPLTLMGSHDAAFLAGTREFCVNGSLMTARYDTVAAAGESRSELLDLAALWAAIKARKLWIIGPTLAALGLSFVAVNLVTPRYTGEARLLLENRDSFYTRPCRWCRRPWPPAP